MKCGVTRTVENVEIWTRLQADYCIVLDVCRRCYAKKAWKILYERRFVQGMFSDVRAQDIYVRQAL